MSNKRFKVPAPPPMLAIRSCIADKAKAVDEARFEALVQTVDQATAMLNVVSEDLEQAQVKLDEMNATLVTATEDIAVLQTDMTNLQSDMTSLETEFQETSTKITQLETEVIETYNTMMENFEIAKEYIDKFDDTIDHLSNIFFPDGAFHFSSLIPSEYIEYNEKYGYHGYLPGNWGWKEDPVATWTIYWYDPSTPYTSEPTTWTDTTSTTAVLDGGQRHINEIPIYAYWCQKAEDWTVDNSVDLSVDPTYTEMPENSITTANS